MRKFLVLVTLACGLLPKIAVAAEFVGPEKVALALIAQKYCVGLSRKALDACVSKYAQVAPQEEGAESQKTNDSDLATSDSKGGAK